jgi:acyl carrier protein
MLAQGSCAERLAAIWRELLDVAAVGPDDDFFDLGGHSVFALQTVHRVFDEFGVEVTIDDLFTFPTLASFAQRIDTLSAQRFTDRPSGDDAP